MNPRFDDLLHTIIVEKGEGVYGFLDVILGFMYRRTDFFYEMAPGENMGFFPGQAEAMIYGYFKKYQELHYKDKVPKRSIDQKEVEAFMKSQKEKGKMKVNEEKEKKEKEKEKQLVEKEVNKLEKEKEKETKSNKENNQIDIHKEDKFVSISTYNGDSCDGYFWSQANQDVQIQIKLPPNTGAKKILVDLKPTKVTITIKDTGKLFFEGEFCEKIKQDDSYWLCEDSLSIILFLTKQTEIIWKSAFKGHKEIDTKTVDNSKKIEEFDNETQAALNKIVYEQNRKKQGLPTTEEEKKLAALREAWDKPDSPFRGQPFDPKMFNLNEPIYYNTPDYEAKLKLEGKK